MVFSNWGTLRKTTVTWYQYSNICAILAENLLCQLNSHLNLLVNKPVDVHSTFLV